jgi:hypothetical protein
MIKLSSKTTLFKTIDKMCPVHNKIVKWAYIEPIKQYVSMCVECNHDKMKIQKQQHFLELQESNKNSFPIEFKDLDFDIYKSKVPKSWESQMKSIILFINNYIHINKYKNLMITNKNYNECKKIGFGILNVFLEKIPYFDFKIEFLEKLFFNQREFLKNDFYDYYSNNQFLVLYLNGFYITDKNVWKLEIINNLILKRENLNRKTLIFLDQKGSKIFSNFIMDKFYNVDLEG